MAGRGPDDRHNRLQDCSQLVLHHDVVEGRTGERGSRLMYEPPAELVTCAGWSNLQMQCTSSANRPLWHHQRNGELQAHTPGLGQLARVCAQRRAACQHPSRFLNAISMQCEVQANAGNQVHSAICQWSRQGLTCGVSSRPSGSAPATHVRQSWYAHLAAKDADDK